MCVKKKKLMFIIHSLAGGGAEKVLIDIITNLDLNKYNIILVLFKAEGVLMEKIPQGVDVFDLKKNSKFSVFNLIIKLTVLIRKLRPDNLIPFMAYADMYTVLAAKLSGIKSKLILTIHTNIIESIKGTWLRPVWYFLCRQAFMHADQLIVPSEGIKDMMIQKFKITEDKITKIPHPLLVSKITQLADEKLSPEFTNKKYILAVGRLTKPKGYKYLLSAFQIVSKENDLNLVILGIGEDREKLEVLTAELGLTSRVIFAGFQKNPYKFMRNSSLFVLSSLFESFAIVLCEAMLCGAPIVSTDCPSGPGELIKNEVNGLLVEPRNVVEIANAMDRILNNKKDANIFIEEGLKKAYSLDVNIIIPLYEELFI